jgi:fatty-acyl-CoA synthase
MPSDARVVENVGVGTWIERRARTDPNRIALVGADRTVTYGEFASRIRRLANGLRRLGVERGERVAWLGPNHPAFMESFFAAGALGAALAPVNHRLDDKQIESILADIGPRVLIEYGSTAPKTAFVPHRVFVSPSSPDTSDFEDLVRTSPDDAIDEQVGLEELCLLAHTSGTTGEPKGIMLTHANITWNIVNFLTCADFRSDDVTIAIAPFFRVGGTGVNVLPVLFLGGTVLVPSGTDSDVLGLMERHRVTVGFGNPDSLQALVQSSAWDRTDLSSVRFILTGGAPVPERLLRAYLDRGVLLVQGYGLSEAGPLALLLDPAHALKKVGAAGRPPLLVDVAIVDKDGAAVDEGQTGELLVRGPNVMAGYWNNPDATRDVLSADGWLRTGDAARRDRDGDIWIVDRVADAFDSGGQRVYPGDIERVFGRHPSVVDVGVTKIDETGGSGVVAVVVTAPGVTMPRDDLLAFGRRHLGPHEAPEAVVFARRLPRTTVGKLLRAEVAAIASGGDASAGVGTRL